VTLQRSTGSAMTFDLSLAAFRYGYGLPQPAGAPDSVPAMLDALAQPDRAAGDHPIVPLSEVAPLMQDFVTRRRAYAKNTGTEAELNAAKRALAFPMIFAGRATIARALSSPDGLRERLVAFWSDHFTTAARDGVSRFLPFALMEEAIRPHLTGRFADMLTAVTLHPAMLIYLDQRYSFGPASRLGLDRGRGLNENLARELIELHTLGVGAPYTQDDVRQMAELLTGVTINKDYEMIFAQGRAEPGSETVLGQDYDGKGLEPVRSVLADLAARPETAAHLARKLAAHFVADTADPDLTDALTVSYLATGGDLRAVYATLLNHPAAWAPEAGKARQPYDFMVAALRGLDIGAGDLMRMAPGPFDRMIVRPMGAMGQPLRAAPGPDGWPEAAEAWITPQGLAARITWAMEVPGRLVTPLPNPVDLAQRALGDRAGERLLWAVARAENRREGVGLVLASPEFNRR